MQHVDVLVVGAGISGISAAHYLKRECPDKSLLIVEGRETFGGTWDLFRYPGIRSDSDMYTLGFAFKPWNNAKAIADGDSIMQYLEETLEEYDIAKHIRYSHWVESVSWSSEEARWTVEIERPDIGERITIQCSFLYVCSGYYDYDHGYTPDFPGMENFGGRLIHPQRWDETVDYENKRVVVIGSGATAVTLVPELAKKAKHVTMLQRSPTYMVSRPSADRLANLTRAALPNDWAYALTRWRFVLLQMIFYRASRAFPRLLRRILLTGIRRSLRDPGQVESHFSPKYDPWDQRICLVPDKDLFEAFNTGTASILTDHIDHFTQTGLQLKSGQHLDADLVVTATGLRLKFLGGMNLQVDGQEKVPNELFAYKSMMLSDVPNLALSFGYTNASWTLKCDLTAQYVCRLINHMDERGYRSATPSFRDASIRPKPFLDFTSGYVQRALNLFPKQGDQSPWEVRQNYAFDIATIRFGDIEDSAMHFRK